MALQFQNRIRMELSSIPGRGAGGNSCVRRFRLIPEEGIAGGAGRRAGLDSRLNIHQFTHRQDFRQAADAIPGPIRSQISPWPRWAESVAQNFPDPPYKPKPTPTMNESMQILLSLPKAKDLSARRPWSVRLTGDFSRESESTMTARDPGAGMRISATHTGHREGRIR